MSPSHATRVWDLHEGTEFSCGEADDYLMELHQYVSSRAARVGWTTALPSYLRWIAGGGDDDDACRLVVKFGEKDDENAQYPSDWKLERFHPPLLLMAAGDANHLNREKIVKFRVYFTDGGKRYHNQNSIIVVDPTDTATATTIAKATVTYMTRCGEQCGYYYVGFFRWVTRCADPGECVALFDAIAADIRTLVALAEQHESDRELVHYLVRERIPLERSDTVRLAAIQRKVKMLQDDSNGYWL
jgi:hypothetical protein